LSLATILLTVMAVMVAASIPLWQQAWSWGYRPNCGIAVIVLSVLALLLLASCGEVATLPSCEMAASTAGRSGWR
jgi:hypothetical protein